jgi:hypothetical protein
MTTVRERARSLVWAGALLVELATDESLPIALRRSAVVIARHFPTTLDIDRMASAPFAPVERTSQEDLVEWLKDFPRGPLLDSTRLRWPEEKQKPAGKRKPAR